jgi:DNA-directed RNA polymerase specialized sigma24 family protein
VNDAVAGGEDFEQWYGREHARLVGTLAWVVGDLDAVREAVDEACARALVRWDRVGRMEAPTRWVYQVALNLWKRSRRRAALEQAVLRRQAKITTTLAGPAGEAWDLVRTLPPRQRTAVALRYVPI